MFFRGAWIGVMVLCAVTSIAIICGLWNKLQTSPTITGLDPDFHKSVIDFPTISICPVIAFDESSVNETAQEFGGTLRFQDFLKDLPSLSFESFSNSYEAFDVETVNFDENLRELAFKVAVKCNDVFKVCKYRNQEVNCCKVFRPFYTEHGFCYAFNGKYISSARRE